MSPVQSDRSYAVLESAEAREDLDGAIVARIALNKNTPVDPDCRLCTFFMSLHIDTGRFKNRPWKLCAFDSLTVRGIYHSRTRSSEPCSIAFTLLTPASRWLQDTARTPILMPINRPRPIMPRSLLTIYRARHLKADSINYDLIKEWLQDCKGKHKRCNLADPKNGPVRVIDCLRRKIVPCTADTVYLALSYVWGAKSNDVATSLPLPCEVDLPDDIPKVIADSMEFVTSICFRYLWVDRWCIDQKDKEEVHEQISCMGKIYQRAIAAIIAVSNESPDKGLPGVSVTRATPEVRISDEVILSARRDLGRTFVTSEWNRRGWTYQEFCLSRRCLVLAEDRVHFICRQGTTCEGVEEDVLSQLPFRRHRSLDPKILDYRDNLNHSSVTRQLAPTFERHHAAYSKRVLSYDSDALNAFRGVLSQSSLQSYWGVPIVKICNFQGMKMSTEEAALADFNLGFSLGLCWKP